MSWITVLIGLMGDLFKAAYNVEADQRAKLVRIASGIALLVVVAVVGIGIYHATSSPDPANPTWETVILARTVLGRAFFGIGLFVLAILCAVLGHNVLEHTSLGKRLLTWADGESAEVNAQKTANGGRLLAVLLVAAALIFGGALR